MTSWTISRSELAHETAIRLQKMFLLISLFTFPLIIKLSDNPMTTTVLLLIQPLTALLFSLLHKRKGITWPTLENFLHISVVVLLIFVAGHRAPAWLLAIPAVIIVPFRSEDKLFSGVMFTLILIIVMLAEFIVGKDPLMLAIEFASLSGFILLGYQMARLNDVLKQEREKAEELLLNTLPAPIAERVQEYDGLIADEHSDVSVLFADLIGFTAFTKESSAAEVLHMLQSIFAAFDELVDAYELEKIRTVGAAYIIAGGLTGKEDHLDRLASCAIEMKAALSVINMQSGQSFQIRIGIHHGPVIAGVVGAKKFEYDLWGETVAAAKVLERTSEADAIHASQAVYDVLKERYRFEEAASVHYHFREEDEPSWVVLNKNPGM